MNRTAVYLIVVVAFTAIGIGVFGPFSTNNNQALHEASAPNPAPIQSSTGSSSNPAQPAAALSGAAPLSDPAPQSRHADRSFGEAVRFVVREVCDENGSCQRIPVADHEYSSYTIDELKVIAEYDGAAAIVLANKLGSVDFNEAKEWALRAFLLTKDPYAFHMVTQYSGVSPGETIDASGNLNTVAAEQAYVWLKMGHMLGVTDGVDLGQQEMILDRHGVPDRARLDRIAEARVAYFNDRRLDLTGRAF